MSLVSIHAGFMSLGGQSSFASRVAARQGVRKAVTKQKSHYDYFFEVGKLDFNKNIIVLVMRSI